MTDKLEIRVAATTGAKDLAGSIVASFSEGKEVTLSCIGAIPVSNAVKAVCIANRTLAPRGVILGILPGLINRKVMNPRKNNEEEDWTITMLRVRNVFESLDVDKVVDIVDLCSKAPGAT